MSKKVCMVVGNTFTHDSRVEKEANSLSRAGYEVVVYALAGKGLLDLEERNGFVVRRLLVSNYSPIHLKFWRLWTQFYDSYMQLIQENADVYHSHDADTLLICFLAAKKNQAKIVYDFHEYWRDKTLWRNRFIGRIWDVFENKVLSLTENIIAPYIDASITVNESLAKEFKVKNRIKKEPIFLYNAPRFSAPSENDRLILRRKVGVGSDTRLVLFLGALSKYRGLDNLINSLQHLDSKFKLVFLGYGSLKEHLEEISKTSEYKGRIYILNPVSSSQVVKWSSGADIGVVPIQNASWSYYHSSPNKIFEYLAAGLPIACSDFPEMRKIVLGRGVGAVFNPEDPRAIATAIEKIFSSKISYQKMRNNALKAASEKYNWKVQERKLLKLYNDLK